MLRHSRYNLSVQQFNYRCNCTYFNTNIIDFVFIYCHEYLISVVIVQI